MSIIKMENTQIMTDEERLAFDKLIENVKQEKVYEEIEKNIRKIIFNKKTYHDDMERYYEVIKIFFIRYSSFKIDLKNFILVLFSCWNLRKFDYRNPNLEEIFNSTFDWISVKENFGIDFELAYEIFYNKYYKLKTEYEGLKTLNLKLKYYYNVIYSEDYFEKIIKKPKIIIKKNY